MRITTAREQAFLKAFNTYANDLFRHCLFRLSDRERAVDLVQDTFTRAWDYLASGGSIDAYRPFLYRTLNNLIVDEYRRKKTVSLDALLEEDGVTEGSFDSLHAGSVEELEFGLDAQRLRGELSEMPLKYQQAVTLRYLEGLMPREIAELTGKNENVISVRIHRGLAWLRKRVRVQ